MSPLGDLDIVRTPGHVFYVCSLIDHLMLFLLFL